MKRHRIARVWFWSALCMAPGASAQTLSQQYARLQALEMPRSSETDSARRSRVTQAFSRLFADAQAHYRKLTVADLHTLLTATVETSDFSESSYLTGDAQSYLAALATRHEASDQDYRNVYDAIVQHRQFARAREFCREHPGHGVKPVPDIVDAASPAPSGQTVYAVADQGTRFVRQSLALPTTGIVVVAQPGCHFSVDAARAIHDDPALAALFRDHSLWIAPAQHPLDPGELGRWNNAFPEAHLAIAEWNGAWPVIDRWSTPTFYIFRNGKLVQETLGWPPSGGWAAFASGLRQIGLIPPPLPPAATASAGLGAAIVVADGAQQIAIDRGTALIRSRTDLDAYLRATPLPDSPIRFLPARRRRLFLAGLVFDQFGTQSVPLAELRGLTATQAYTLLSLFGWQGEVRSIHGLKTESAVDRALMTKPEAAAERSAPL